LASKSSFVLLRLIVGGKYIHNVAEIILGRFELNARCKLDVEGEDGSSRSKWNVAENSRDQRWNAGRERQKV
jgi:hypothetical protein